MTKKCESFPIILFDSDQLKFNSFSRVLSLPTKMNNNSFEKHLKKYFKFDVLNYDHIKRQDGEYQELVNKYLKPRNKGELTMYHPMNDTWYRINRNTDG